MQREVFFFFSIEMSSSLANLSRDHYRGGVVIVKRHPSGACHFSRGARVSTVKQQQVTRDRKSKRRNACRSFPSSPIILRKGLSRLGNRQFPPYLARNTMQLLLPRPNDDGLPLTDCLSNEFARLLLANSHLDKTLTKEWKIPFKCFAILNYSESS